MPDSVEGRRTALRFRLARRLLDEPVLYHDELTSEEFKACRAAPAKPLGLLSIGSPESRESIARPYTP